MMLLGIFFKKPLNCFHYFTRIPAAIIELLHLLPQSAAKFLDLLVTNVIQLEANLPKGSCLLIFINLSATLFFILKRSNVEGHAPKVLNSPYRLPLIKYLNHYAHETINYFFQRRDLPQRQLFWLILRTQEAEPIR